jgi:hypothetical protein
MEQAMKIKILVSVLLTTTLFTTSSSAVTPTPKPTAKVSKKATPKPAASAKPASAKPSVSSKTTATKKPTKKPVKKKKKKVKKTATPIPSPSPVWPPVGFTSKGGIYAKIPTGKELLGLLSAKVKLADDVKKCEKNACGAVVVAADIQCRWWEIRSTVSMIDPADPAKKILLGSLRTTYNSLSPRTYANILLISDEPLYLPAAIDPATNQELAPVLRTGISIGGISATCHKATTNEVIPTSVYTPFK